MLKNIFLLFLLFLNSLILPQMRSPMQQSITKRNICGRVEGKEKMGIPNIVIFIEGNGQNTYTVSDSWGNFCFQMLPGNYRITFKNIPEIEFSPSSLMVDAKDKDVNNRIISVSFSSKGKKNLDEGKKLVAEALKAGYQLIDLVLSIPCPNCPPITPLLSGDPRDALPPGLKVYYGTGLGVMVKGKVVLGDKGLKITDPEYRD